MLSLLVTFMQLFQPSDRRADMSGLISSTGTVSLRSKCSTVLAEASWAPKTFRPSRPKEPMPAIGLRTELRLELRKGFTSWRTPSVRDPSRRWASVRL
jgi:hypothetical protein